jgi:hypothetical protein
MRQLYNANLDKHVEGLPSKLVRSLEGLEEDGLLCGGQHP